MIKRLILSLAIIALALVGVTGATYAYFSSGAVLGSNTFATGNVGMNGWIGGSLNVTGLTPGQSVWVYNEGVNYTGSIPADLYIGVTGTTAYDTPGYLADKLWVSVYPAGSDKTANPIWSGLAQDLSGNWLKVATNVNAGPLAYDLKFTLDSSANNTYQGQTNTDTLFLFYTVQANGPTPSTSPYVVYKANPTGWFNLP
jgi:predicted ribosomally synthesized peptide with SipW-like signal peptide